MGYLKRSKFTWFLVLWLMLFPFLFLDVILFPLTYVTQVEKSTPFRFNWQAAVWAEDSPFGSGSSAAVTAPSATGTSLGGLLNKTTTTSIPTKKDKSIQVCTSVNGCLVDDPCVPPPKVPKKDDPMGFYKSKYDDWAKKNIPGYKFCLENSPKPKEAGLSIDPSSITAENAADVANSAASAATKAVTKEQKNDGGKEPSFYLCVRKTPDTGGNFDKAWDKNFAKAAAGGREGKAYKCDMANFKISDGRCLPINPKDATWMCIERKSFKPAQDAAGYPNFIGPECNILEYNTASCCSVSAESDDPNVDKRNSCQKDWEDKVMPFMRKQWPNLQTARSNDISEENGNYVPSRMQIFCEDFLGISGADACNGVVNSGIFEDLSECSFFLSSKNESTPDPSALLMCAAAISAKKAMQTKKLIINLTTLRLLAIVFLIDGLCYWLCGLICYLVMWICNILICGLLGIICLLIAWVASAIEALVYEIITLGQSNKCKEWGKMTGKFCDALLMWIEWLVKSIVVWISHVILGSVALKNKRYKEFYKELVEPYFLRNAENLFSIDAIFQRGSFHWGKSFFDCAKSYLPQAYNLVKKFHSLQIYFDDFAEGKATSYMSKMVASSIGQVCGPHKAVNSKINDDIRKDAESSDDALSKMSDPDEALKSVMSTGSIPSPSNATKQVKDSARKNTSSTFADAMARKSKGGFLAPPDLKGPAKTMCDMVRQAQTGTYMCFLCWVILMTFTICCFAEFFRKYYEEVFKHYTALAALYLNTAQRFESKFSPDQTSSKSGTVSYTASGEAIKAELRTMAKPACYNSIDCSPRTLGEQLNQKNQDMQATAAAGKAAAVGSSTNGTNFERSGGARDGQGFAGTSGGATGGASGGGTQRVGLSAKYEKQENETLDALSKDSMANMNFIGTKMNNGPDTFKYLEKTGDVFLEDNKIESYVQKEFDKRAKEAFQGYKKEFDERKDTLKKRCPSMDDNLSDPFFQDALEANPDARKFLFKDGKTPQENINGAMESPEGKKGFNDIKEQVTSNKTLSILAEAIGAENIETVKDPCKEVLQMVDEQITPWTDYESVKEFGFQTAEVIMEEATRDSKSPIIDEKFIEGFAAHYAKMDKQIGAMIKADMSKFVGMSIQNATENRTNSTTNSGGWERQEKKASKVLEARSKEPNFQAYLDRIKDIDKAPATLEAKAFWDTNAGKSMNLMDQEGKKLGKFRSIFHQISIKYLNKEETFESLNAEGQAIEIPQKTK